MAVPRLLIILSTVLLLPAVLRFLDGSIVFGHRTETLTAPNGEIAPRTAVAIALVFGTLTITRKPFFDQVYEWFILMWNAASFTKHNCSDTPYRFAITLSLKHVNLRFFQGCFVQLIEDGSASG